MEKFNRWFDLEYTSSLSLMERYMLHYLISNYNRFGGAFYRSISTMEFDLDIGKASVNRCIKSLKEKGLIEVSESNHKSYNHKPYNEYTINFERLNEVMDNWKEEKMRLRERYQNDNQMVSERYFEWYQNDTNKLLRSSINKKDSSKLDLIKKKNKKEKVENAVGFNTTEGVNNLCNTTEVTNGDSLTNGFYLNSENGVECSEWTEETKDRKRNGLKGTVDELGYCYTIAPSDSLQSQSNIHQSNVASPSPRPLNRNSVSFVGVEGNTQSNEGQTAYTPYTQSILAEERLPKAADNPTEGEDNTAEGMRTIPIVGGSNTAAEGTQQPNSDLNAGTAEPMETKYKPTADGTIETTAAEICPNFAPEGFKRNEAINCPPEQRKPVRAAENSLKSNHTQFEGNMVAPKTAEMDRKYRIAMSKVEEEDDWDDIFTRMEVASDHKMTREIEHALQSLPSKYR